MANEKEISRRRSFGIISHPDAGKTTLTEKLLLFGGAIQTAGAVKSNKAKTHAASDFMEIEKQRGISVATSVMGFDYKDFKINLLDTPGHQDFCEDTYRTLTAVDSVVMVIDCSKGVESQTEKLLEVCRMRNTPVITFINKLDREGMEPEAVLDNIEKQLKITVSPLSWPIGIGRNFKGVYSIYEKKLILFSPHGKQKEEDIIEIRDLFDPRLEAAVGEDATLKLRADLDLVSGIYPAFTKESYLAGEITPVFFGSAINNFGVKELLDCFVEIAPSPKSRMTDLRQVDPTESSFSGFVFKIHANMDPRHRNRLAFLCVCSGKFERNKNYKHVRLDRTLKFASPTAFLAQEKSIIDEAFPGDIVGLHDTGNFKIGDTLSDGEMFQFQGIPHFSPEIFRYVINTDPMKTKQLNKGVDQLMDEGVAQLFVMKNSQRQVIGTVGALQFEVIQFRLLHEYGASCRFEPVEFFLATWLEGSEKDIKSFVDKKSRHIAMDKDGRFVFMAESRYLLGLAEQENPSIKFHRTSEY